MIGILIDVTRCVGCERCVAACVEENGCDPDRAEYDKAVVKDGLSANRLCTVMQLDDFHNVKKSCMHCLEPSCVQACLVGGITKSENGAVVYDPDKCIGCRYCMIACPFHIPRYEWDKKVPFMKKCELCEDRLAVGKQPACVEACPENALQYGEREEMLAEAHRRIKNSPNKYINHVWGETELGGTSVLYISDVDLSLMDWPESDSKPIPEITKPALHSTPFIAGSVLAGVAGLNWIVRRRMDLMKPENSSKAQHDESQEKD